MPDRRLIKTMCFSLGIALIVVIISLTQVFHRLEHHIGLGLLYKLRGPISPPHGALIVAIDRDTVIWLRRILKHPKEIPAPLSGCLPQSTWAEFRRIKGPQTIPRSIYACLLMQLKKYGFPVVAFDIVFSTAGLEQDNKMLAQAIQAHGATTLLVGLKHYTNDKGGVPVEIKHQIHPLSIFKKHAAAIGLFTVPGTKAPVYGYWRQFEGFEDASSLIEETYNIYRGAKPPKTIPPEKREKLSYLWTYGAPGAITTVSIRDVLSDAIPESVRKMAKETVVFVGASDPNNTSFADTFPPWFPGKLEANISGVELAATAFLNLKMDEQLKRLSWPLELLVLGSFVVFLIVIAKISIASTPFIIVALAVTYLVGAAVAFSQFLLFLPVSTPLFIVVPVAFLLAVITRLRKAVDLTGRLAPRPVARRWLNRMDQKVDFVSEDATIVFIDIIRSTTIGEQLSESDFGKLINAFYEILTREIKSRNGLVIDFRGDGVSAIFDNSHTGGEHALKACQTIISTVQKLGTLNAKNAKEGVPALGLRVGMNTGLAAIGGIGAQDRFGFSMVGDVVNLASRFEQLGKELYPGEANVILVGDETHRRVEGDLLFDNCGLVDIKGREKKEHVFRLRIDK